MSSDPHLHAHDSSVHAPHLHGDEPRAAGFSWGLLLGLIGAVGICWLGATGQLSLYIHPRYNLFTLVMAGFGIIACLAAWAVRARSGGRGRAWGAAAAAIAMVLALFVVPPATLSSSTAQNRSPAAGVDPAEITRLAGADPSSFTLRDWAALVDDPGSVAAYAGQQVTLTGFVTPVDGDDVDVFYLARFVVTCCTVDARPVAVPVALPDWADQHKADQWVRITGRMVPAQNAPGEAVLMLQPAEITPIDQPDQPYEY
ncbi:TIGR03943 family putative permease subunit [Micropruina sp.]|uniref:TIGR03943 family putative permease subunit n=1 Tax=Micropruina sp. TaxID=2737536 RepID=UPI0039E5DD37